MNLSLLAKEATVAGRRALLPVLRRLRPRRYTDADPYRVLHIDPSRIDRMQKRWSGELDLPWLEGSGARSLGSFRRRWHAGSVLAGGWDLATKSFEDHHLSGVLRARFVEGAEWEEIPYVRRAIRKARRGNPSWGGRCGSEAEVRARCRYLDGLHAEMQREGYGPPVERAVDAPRYTDFLVNIGRDGSIIRNNDGKHRIILARLLGIPSIRARVLVRHVEWQEVRNRIARGDRQVAGAFRAHPDLEDLEAA